MSLDIFELLVTRAASKVQAEGVTIRLRKLLEL
jgi:hypothetical protein